MVRVFSFLGILGSLLSILFGNLLAILNLIWYWLVYWYLGWKHVEEYFFFHTQPGLKDVRKSTANKSEAKPADSSSASTSGVMPKDWKPKED